MSKLNFSISVFFLFALSLVKTAYGAVNICEDVGFFSLFLEEKLKLINNTCDDADNLVTIRVAPTGLQLIGLNGTSTNAPIPLMLNTDGRATATGIKQFGVSGHNGTFTVKDGDQINIFLQNSTGGSCNAIAKGGSRCLYDVVTSSCPGNLIPGDRVCAACTAPKSCPDYGSNKITVFVQGTPVVKCDVTLTRVFAACGTCNGKSIVPVTP